MRGDIPLADQIVQVGHACLEAGSRFPQPDTACNLVLLGVASEKHLLDAVENLDAAGIRCVVFHEPDGGMGYSACCSEPIAGSRRRSFRKFALWNSANATKRARPPPRTTLAKPGPSTHGDDPGLVCDKRHMTAPGENTIVRVHLQEGRVSQFP